MSKAAFVRARIEPELKNEAETILHECGMSVTQVITMLYKQIAREHEVPLSMKIPNALTQKTMEETDQGIDLNEAKSVDDLFKKLGI